jgi:hypothetical protein
LPYRSSCADEAAAAAGAVAIASNEQCRHAAARVLLVVHLGSERSVGGAPRVLFVVEE